MTGSLKWIGNGRWPPERMREILEVRDRTQSGPTAPPHGLCLTAVDYNDN